MKERVIIFMTGQFRCFWKSWWNMLDMIIFPNMERLDISVCLGLDGHKKTNHEKWDIEERQLFQDVVHIVWNSINMNGELRLYWLDRNNKHLVRGVSSLKRYVDNRILEPHWFEYLVYRSGSCLEYAQFAQLYEQYHDYHYLLRFRADTLLRHPLMIHEPIGETWNAIFSSYFPSTDHFKDYIQPTGREYSIHEPDRQRWIMTLRKNLIYLIPFDQAAILCKIIAFYGDWDTPFENRYWFNAESQFRGCLRHHGFNIFEFSQEHDECFGYFLQEEALFPIYAIQRKF